MVSPLIALMKNQVADNKEIFLLLISSILWMVLELILSEFLRWVLLLLWIRLKRKMTLSNSKIMKAMSKNNIWKVIIGAISAALGYVLNAIGL